MSEHSKKDYKIVVVDDSDFSRRNIVSILEAEGFYIAGQASNVLEALKHSINLKAQLYIIDILIPEKNGIEILQDISEKQSNCSFIMVSTLESESIIVESISNGAIDFLIKPLDSKDLIQAVDKAYQEFLKD